MLAKRQSPEHIVDRMSRIDLEQLVLTIYKTLDGTEWDSGTACTIVNVLTDAGLPAINPPVTDEYCSGCDGHHRPLGK